jgi:hypothetical protein
MGHALLQEIIYSPAGRHQFQRQRISALLNLHHDRITFLVCSESRQHMNVGTETDMRENGGGPLCGGCQSQSIQNFAHFLSQFLDNLSARPKIITQKMGDLVG